MNGEHKLWKLPKKEYQKVNAGLRPVKGPHPVLFK